MQKESGRLNIPVLSVNHNVLHNSPGREAGNVTTHVSVRPDRYVFRRSLGGPALRTLTVEAFHETVTYCFTKVLETMGVSVREVVYAHLNKKGIAESDICTKFDDVFKVLTESFGGSARIIIYKTITELFQQYSSRVDFTYQDPLRVQFFALRERVIADHLLPRRTQGPGVDMYDTLRTVFQSAPLARSP